MDSLSLACRKRDLPTVRPLLSAGAAVESAATFRGYRPLHWAVGAAPLVSELVNGAGADVNSADDDGCTALHRAADLVDWESLKVLLARPDIELAKVRDVTIEHGFLPASKTPVYK